MVSGDASDPAAQRAPAPAAASAAPPRPAGPRKRPAPPWHQAPRWRYFWWSLMAAAIFWSLAYRLSQVDGALPDFVYVNF